MSFGGALPKPAKRSGGRFYNWLVSVWIRIDNQKVSFSTFDLLKNMWRSRLRKHIAIGFVWLPSDLPASWLSFAFLSRDIENRLSSRSSAEASAWTFRSQVRPRSKLVSRTITAQVPDRVLSLRWSSVLFFVSWHSWICVVVFYFWFLSWVFPNSLFPVSSFGWLLRHRYSIRHIAWHFTDPFGTLGSHSLQKKKRLVLRHLN